MIAVLALLFVLFGSAGDGDLRLALLNANITGAASPAP